MKYDAFCKMGISNYVPLFRISGSGPLGMQTIPSDHGMSAAVLRVNPTIPYPLSSSVYVGAGTGSLGGLLGGRRDQLLAAPSDPSDPTDTGGIRESSGLGAKSYSIKIVSGTFLGSTFALPSERELVIGRLRSSDIALVEDMVSRRHAKISMAGDDVVLVDLGSPSGTYVNGQKIQKATLKEGDRILIGSTLLSLSSAPAPEHPVAPARETPVPDSGKASSKSRMSGLLDTVSLPDLLQMLCGAQKSGVISLSSERGFAKIYLRKGRIYFCSIEGSPDVHPRKALYRLFNWTEGSYSLDPHDEIPVSPELTDSIDSLLMNGTCDLDEINRFGADLPKPGARLSLNLATARLRDLSPEELDDFQSVLPLVLQYGTLEGFLDHYVGSDLEAYKHLIPWIKKGLIQV